MITKNTFKFLLFFLSVILSKDNHADSITPLILSYPEDRNSTTTLEIIKTKSNVSNVRFTLNERDLNDCTLIKSVSIKNNLNFWKKMNSVNYW